MIYAGPMPYQEALDAAEVRTILPTTGNSADIARLRRLEPALLRRSMWSATVDVFSRVQAMADSVNAVLSGQADQATAVAELGKALEREGYSPKPGEFGTIKDLRTIERRRLIVETNVATAQGYGWREQGMQAEVLDEFPAQELFRAFGPDDAAKRRNWADRWQQAGGEFFGNRMIALKTDQVWERLGTMFDDSLGNPYPPFAFNSGMEVRDIDRDEAQALGLIDEATTLFPQPLNLNAELEASPDVRADWLRSAMEETGVGRFDGDVFKFNQESE